MLARLLVRRTAERRLERGQAAVPAGGVAGGLEAVVEGVGEDQDGAVVAGADLVADDVLAPGVGQDPRRVVLGHLAFGHLVSVGQGVEADAAPWLGLELERAGVPGGLPVLV